MTDFIKIPICDKKTLMKQIHKRTLDKFLLKKMLRESKDLDVILILPGICEVYAHPYTVFYTDLKDDSQSIVNPLGRLLPMTDEEWWIKISQNLATIIETSIWEEEW